MGSGICIARCKGAASACWCPTNGPFGPFTDPIGKPLIGGQYDSIDPTVFIDDDGQAYLCWGNPRCWYVKLNKDMISYDTSIGDKGLVVQDMTVEAFGKRSKDDPKRATTYEEGPWLYKRNALYYLFFAGGPISEHLGYSTGPSPNGPWKYGGVVMPTQGTQLHGPSRRCGLQGKNLPVLPQWRPARRRRFPSFRLCGRDEV